MGEKEIMEWAGWISAAAFSACYLPQLWKTWRLKSVEDISVWMWIIQGVAYLSGLMYGAWLDKWPLILNYSLGLLYTYIWLLMWIQFRDPRKEAIRKEVRQMLRELNDEKDY